MDEGKILIADDEEIFLVSTADLLKREGFDCDCAQNAEEAIGLAKEKEYDLLIADIKMPGNSDLQLIRDVNKGNMKLPTILVTGYPSSESAIDAVSLPVVAYMVKPFEMDLMLENVKKAVKKTRMNKMVTKARDRLDYFVRELAQLEEMLQNDKHFNMNTNIENFIELSWSNIAATFGDVKNLIHTLAHEKKDEEVCSLMNCPRLNELQGAVKETVFVLEKTKDSFKSKELAKLRKNLEKILHNH